MAHCRRPPSRKERKTTGGGAAAGWRRKEEPTEGRGEGERERERERESESAMHYTVGLWRRRGTSWAAKVPRPGANNDPKGKCVDQSHQTQQIRRPARESLR